MDLVNADATMKDDLKQTVVECSNVLLMSQSKRKYKMKFSTFRILLSNGNISLMDIRNDNIQLRTQGLILSCLPKTHLIHLIIYFIASKLKITCLKQS